MTVHRDMQIERILLEYEKWHIDVHSLDRQEITEIKGTTGKIVWVTCGHRTCSGCRNREVRAERLAGGR